MSQVIPPPPSAAQTAPQTEKRETSPSSSPPPGTPAFYARRRKRSNEICQLLIRHGDVKVEHVRQGLKIQEERGGQIGRILVKMGACSERAIARALTRQVQLAHQGKATRVSTLAREHPALAGLEVLCRPDLTVAALVLSDVLVLFATAAVAYAIDRRVMGGHTSPAFLHYGFSGLLLIPVVLALMSLYSPTAPSPPDELRKTSSAITLVFMGGGAVAMFGMVWIPWHVHAILLLEWMACLALIPIVRAVVRLKLSKRGWWGLPVVVLGAGKTGRTLVRALQMRPHLGLRPVVILDDDARRLGTLRASVSDADAEDIQVTSIRDAAVHSIQRVDAASSKAVVAALAQIEAARSTHDVNRGHTARDVAPHTIRSPSSNPPREPFKASSFPPPSSDRAPASSPPASPREKSDEPVLAPWFEDPDEGDDNVRSSMFPAAPSIPPAPTTTPALESALGPSAPHTQAKVPSSFPPKGPSTFPPKVLSSFPPHRDGAHKEGGNPSSRPRSGPLSGARIEHPESLRYPRGQFAEVEGVPVIGSLDLAPLLAERLGIHYAIVAMPGVRSRKLLQLTERVGGAFSHLLVIPDLFGFASVGVPAREVGGVLGVEVRQQLLLPGPRLAKRVMDIALTLAGGLFVFPIILLLALLIKLDSKGPAFYPQKRLGRDGKRFTALKFRSMHGDGEDRLKAVLASDPKLQAEYDEFHKLSFDPRVTRIGRKLRKYSLDELPQLWNVLRGEMSLVGPRPYLEREIPEMEHQEGMILRAMPGMTGMWQVSDRNATGFPERLKMDVHYVRNWSPWLDIYILARTINVVIAGTGS
jgi:exopolysaccharide biosynthesis polyprenyl glycosylphosphotransferase